MSAVCTSTSPVRAAGAPPRTVGILSTYPPTACGLATFSAALVAGLVAHGAEARVVRVADQADKGRVADEVVGELVNGVPASVDTAAGLLNECDVAIIQHEYGVYGGADGDEVIDILAAIDVPTMVIAHTALLEPTPHQQSVLVDIATLADRMVVMSEVARDRLCGGFDVDPAKVTTIPHGALVPAAAQPAARGGRSTMLTWGLVGPGKGIERVIDAMPNLRDLSARPRYIVAGRTHPKVLAAEGERYRNARIEQTWRRGVAASVTFDPSYRDVSSLTALIQSASVVVLPYDSHDQATSGVLVDAIAAGRPVVATAFPHAVEMLASGAGIVVDHDDHDALVHALRRLLGDQRLMVAMAAEAARIAPSLGWPVVTRAYLDLATTLLETRRPVFA